MAVAILPVAIVVTGVVIAVVSLVLVLVIATSIARILPWVLGFGVINWLFRSWHIVTAAAVVVVLARLR